MSIYLLSRERLYHHSGMELEGCVAKKEMTCKGLSPAQSGSLSGQATP
jgi:hypothetical protein